MSLSKSIAIVYHSPYGHTAKVANCIAQGAMKVGAHVFEMDIEHIDWDVLDQADAIVFGCPTYMGNLTSGLKLFMEQSSKRWLARAWQGKLAAGFTNGGGLSGDKLAVLQQINLFAMQHGMLWTGLPLMPTGRSTHDLNRMSSFLGLMTQSDNAPVEVTPPAGDLETAVWFGEYIGLMLNRIL
ncbi:flavodoxin family protein [Acinetobacter wuhouensis]|uniref:Flavodoxin family protein n=1 Tax=Acinetobacter wuhouensis TaxID=1879050 RepID=A0A4Q7AE91_9GAMM|nr:flavodoxin family protein [Acinetobacter wuhouensis]RZG45012.1 flavodoxin family protein [Acinetobacter wuhouensis]RZG73729.1 flavodoxin family protein [Acinetobacter wuhouensis]